MNEVISSDRDPRKEEIETMTQPLMPKATAVWLIENTALSFEQIAAFCELHVLEVQAIADGESAIGMIGMDPIMSGQLTAENIQHCEANPSATLQLIKPVDADSILGKKKSKYTPLAKRQERPDAIAWILKYHPEISETRICRLLGTTRNMIASIRGKTHWNSANIQPKNPVLLGLCTQIELDRAIDEARRTASQITV